MTPKNKKRLFLGTVLFILLLVNLPFWILSKGRIVSLENLDASQHFHAAVILGCSKTLSDGRSNLFFLNRMQAAAEVYRAGKADVLIVSGDNHRVGYDEPTDMKEALVALGVPADRIVCDYAGFRTLDSVLRAGKVFGQSSFLVISQGFHARRAVFLGRAHGLDVHAVAAPDVARRFSLKTRIREQFARAAAIWDVLIRRGPKFYGDPVPLPMGYKDGAEFRRVATAHLQEKLTEALGADAFGGAYKGKGSYPHILARHEDWPKLLLPGVRKEAIPEDQVQEFAHHVNSSQMLCVNFFEPLTREENLPLLQRFLSAVCGAEAGPIDPSKGSFFEYTPDGPFLTNFDFHAETQDGFRFFLEIKYTENGFATAPGGASKRSRKSRDIFREQRERSLYLRDMSEDDFFADYQVARNVVYVQGEKDFSLFVYPFANPALFLPEWTKPLSNVVPLDWCRAVDVIDGLLPDGHPLHEHYHLLRERYLTGVDCAF